MTFSAATKHSPARAVPPTGYLVWLSAEVFAWVSALPVAEFTGADAIEAHALRGLEAAQ